MRKNRTFLHGIIMLGLLHSCTSYQPLQLRLEPESHEKEKTYWENGNLYTVQQRKRITIHTAYMGIERSMLCFNFKIKNASRKSVLVDPATLYYEYTLFPPSRQKKKYVYTSREDYLKHKELEKNNKSNKKNIQEDNFVFAFDPKERIVEVENRIKGEHKKYNTEQVINVAGSCLSGLASLAAASANDAEGMDEADRNMDELRDDAKENEKQHYRRLKRLEKEKAMWKDTAILHKHTLLPGQSIIGKVYFPAYRETDTLVLYVLFKDKLSFECNFKNNGEDLYE